MSNTILNQSIIDNFYEKQNSIISASKACGKEPPTDIENTSLEIWKVRRYNIEKNIVENELTLWEAILGPIEDWELIIHPVVADDWDKTIRYRAFINDVDDDDYTHDTIQDVVVYRGRAVETHKYFLDYTYFGNPWFESEDDTIEDGDLTLSMDKLLQYISETDSKEKGIEKYADMEVLQSFNFEAYYALTKIGAA